MRQTPLRRRKPLRTSRTKKRKAPRRVAKMTAEEREYRGWVHEQPCVAALAYFDAPDGTLVQHVCLGRIEQSHERHNTGLGLKAPEMRSVAMCSDLHRQWEEYRGLFRHWSRDRRVDFMVRYIAESNERFLRERYQGQEVPF